jgi:hypothetical protein
MTVFIEHIRKMMGWCPQEDFNLMHARKGNCETVSVTHYKNDEFSEKGTKIVIDYRYLRFETSAIILFALFFGLLIILITAGFVFPETINLIFLLLPLLLLLGSIVLLYQDRTSVIFTSNAIIIKRLLLHPIVISKDSILKT